MGKNITGSTGFNNSWRTTLHSSGGNRLPSINSTTNKNKIFSNKLNELLDTQPSIGTNNNHLKPLTRGANPIGQVNGDKLLHQARLGRQTQIINRSHWGGSEKFGKMGSQHTLVKNNFGTKNGSSNKIAKTHQYDNLNMKGYGANNKPQTRLYYEKLAEDAATRHGVDPHLVKAVITAESDYNPSEVSSAGAMGLMQLMPETAKDMDVRNPFDPKQNIEGGVKYLAWLQSVFGADEKKVLAAYNWGPGNVQNGGNMPEETRNYLVKVAKFKHQYSKADSL